MDEPKKRRPGIGFWCCSGIVFYVLSAIPMGWAACQDRIPAPVQHLVGMIYLPLIYVVLFLLEAFGVLNLNNFAHS